MENCGGEFPNHEFEWEGLDDLMVGMDMEEICGLPTAGLAQPVPHPVGGAAGMEIPALAENAHSAFGAPDFNFNAAGLTHQPNLQNPVGDIHPSAPAATGTEIPRTTKNAPPPEFNLLEVKAGLAQPADPSSVVLFDFSTATGEQIIDYICARLEQNKEPKKMGLISIDAALPKLNPWDLPVQFYLASVSGSWSSDEKTQGGSWKDRDNGVNVIRRGTALFGHPRYVGLKRTREFYMADGTKTSWLMDETAMLSTEEDHYIIEDSLVLRRVYQSDVSSYASCIGGNPDEDVPNRNNKIPHSGCMHQDAAPNNQPPFGKRPRTVGTKTSGSKPWHQHFTRICIRVPKEAGSKGKKESKKVMYAVCKYCENIYNVDTGIGTSQHKRHGEACQLKQQSQPSSSSQAQATA